MKKILIIDDDLDICLLLTRFFEKNGFASFYAKNGSDGVGLMKKEVPDAVLCDFKLPDYTGLEVLQKLKIIHPQVAVVIITGYSDVRQSVKALKFGAYDYVTKPLFPDEILATVHDALEAQAAKIDARKSSLDHRSIKSKNNKTTTAPSKGDNTPTSPNYIIGKSPESLLVQKHIEIVAPTDMSVLIIGETGSGKEVIAQEIHRLSPRHDQPFVAIDCGALPKDLVESELFGHVKGSFTGALQDKVGSFEFANGGTLFLDEIGNLDYNHQVKLLRVLQERKISRVGSNKKIDLDIRIIAATNDNLLKSSDKGDFRSDIYYRLNEFKIDVKPLRDRKEDIVLFINHFVSVAQKSLNKEIHKIEPSAMSIFKNYNWPGNLREMKNLIKRTVLLTTNGKITVQEIPEEITNKENNNLLEEDDSFENLTLKQIAARAEKKAIIKTLEKTRSKKEAAKILAIDRKTLYNKMQAYNISGDYE